MYHAVWTLYIGEQLSCALDSGNSKDPYAVAVQKDGETIGHVPRTISCGVGGVGVNCGNWNPKRKQASNSQWKRSIVDRGPWWYSAFVDRMDAGLCL